MLIIMRSLLILLLGDNTIMPIIIMPQHNDLYYYFV
ncbi:hypothetical protein PCC8801_0460 [Rippkaea orientalis PCC 8801]|uniref:Uncharacterized protein n=1 Tax=Rippkaea orientalis (strain PCC 8801 / RF-1) TaxID=41431 RepID=B7JUH6_RIPO1|nr:hypothetical protein PCC8801_0460 [Rippkaea orientalis PCC 8801]